MNRTILILIGIACAVITAAGITFSPYNPNNKGINLWQAIDPQLKSYQASPIEYDGNESYEKGQRAVRAKMNKYFIMRKSNQFGAVRITRKTTDYDGGAEYEWYLQEDGSGNFLKDNCKHGYGKVFENYRKEKTGDNKYNVTDIGGVLKIKCGPFAVEWSGGNWIYLNDSVEIAFSTVSSLKKIDVFDKNLEWFKKTTEKDIGKLREQFKDKDYIIRYYATKYLGELDDKEAIPEIKKLLKDENKDVREAAEEALKFLGVPESEIEKAKETSGEVIKLRQQLNDTNPEVRNAAVWAMWELGAKEAIPDIIKLLQDNDPVIRQSATIVLSNFVAKEAIPDITKLLQDNEFRVRLEAVSALGNIRAKESIPEMTKLLQDDNPLVRYDAVWALSKLYAKEAIPGITRLLKDTDIKIRYAAVYALGNLNAKEAIPEIAKLLQDTDAGVRRGAVCALGTLDAKELTPEVIKLLHDDYDKIRQDTIDALVKFEAKAAIPEIKKLLKDENKDVRDTAEEALKKLGVPEAEIQKAKEGE